MRLAADFRKRCEAISVDWRYRLRLRPYDALPAELLLEALKGEAVPPERIPNAPADAVHRLLAHDDWSAAVIRQQPLLIVVHPNHLPARRQSDLMHELAHVLLDHPMTGFSPETGLPLRNARYEDEATYLGGCLQIPRLGLMWAAQRGYSCARTAEYFGASEAMVRFRCNMTGIRVLCAY